MVFYENESCVEGSRFLTLRINFGGNKMENPITIREAITKNEVALFWKQLHNYYKRDIFPDTNAEERADFIEDEYRTAMRQIHDRAQDMCRYLFFQRNGQNIGFALPMIHNSEDGKCFIVNFCVYPEYRGNGTGKECAEVLLNWAKVNGANYAELNYGDDDRRLRFWKSVGFIENGVDECGKPLLLLPPNDEKPFAVGVLDDPTDRQLLKLINGFKKDIGEESLTKEKQQQLQQAIKDGRITFFIAKRGCRAVGMCSVAKSFSTFACTDTGIFEDFYIEPAFRRKGIARMLAQAAQRQSEENGLASLTVTCAPCDEGMYQALGFNLSLGTTFAHI